jgi:hypothetical protein
VTTRTRRKIDAKLKAKMRWRLCEKRLRSPTWRNAMASLQDQGARRLTRRPCAFSGSRRIAAMLRAGRWQGVTQACTAWPKEKPRDSLRAGQG